jgi:2,4-dienoyl-CoA reductase-like NADH-dependent reductase (Old Yellow Enzyme family)
MSMTRPSLFDSLSFSRGPSLKNRFMLAPMTNCQSRADGQISAEEQHWLVKRAQGGFGGVMTCAAHVQAIGQGFPGQLGVFGEQHQEGLTRLAAGLREAGAVSNIQLHHGGMRSPSELIGEQPVCPSDDSETGARALTPEEVEGVIEDFIAAAERSQHAGFDGVELHAAHGYLLGQFLSVETNHRTDAYGGSLENRSRVLKDILTGIRTRCGANLTVGVRISPERYGMCLEEARSIAEQLMGEGAIDFLDVSLWDCGKFPVGEEDTGKLLISHFTELPRGEVRLGVAGKIYGLEQANACLEAGADFVLPGRVAILHHDFPDRIQRDTHFEMASLPVTRDYLNHEGLGPAFIDYMSRWEGFVAAE